jgi:peroxiredoxin
MNLQPRSALVFFLILIVFFSCSQKPSYEEPVAEPSRILQDMGSFLDYRERYVNLYKDFKALNTASEVITKENFLKYIATGDYLPLCLKSADSAAIYQLYKMSTSDYQDIKEVIRDWGMKEYANYLLEGKELPEYNFVDLEGKTYTKLTTKGKIMVLKCWFVDCLPCIKEMPALNALKQQYKDRDDIVFVSITWDSKEDLKAFLKKTTFDYAVVPEQEKYLEDSLQLNTYPTHFVINRQGLIAKKVTDYRDMVDVLQREALQ